MGKIISGLFGDDTPAPAPVPASPAFDAEAERKRNEAAAAAQAESASRGRRSTIVAGMNIAGEEQYQKGLLASKKRAAARDLGG